MGGTACMFAFLCKMVVVFHKLLQSLHVGVLKNVKLHLRYLHKSLYSLVLVHMLFLSFHWSYKYSKVNSCAAKPPPPGYLVLV